MGVSICKDRQLNSSTIMKVLGLFCTVWMTLTSITAAPAPFIDLGSLVIGGGLVAAGGTGSAIAAASIPITPLIIGKAILGAKAVALASILSNMNNGSSSTNSRRHHNMHRTRSG